MRLAPPASASGLRPSRAALENACAFPQLRTLAGSNPMHLAQKRKASIAGGLTNQWWAMRDVACGFAARFRFGPAALACCAGKRFAFPQLRTLAGSNPSAMGPYKNGPLSRTVSNSVVGDEGCPRAAGAARAPLRRSAPRVLRWKTLARFLSSAPLRVRIPLRWAHTKTVPFRGPFPIRWWAMRDSNPQPCACKAPALTVAPIARAERV